MIKKIKNKAIDVTSDILSAKPRWNVKEDIKQSTYDTATLKKARAYDNAPDFVGGKPTDAFKVRAMADEVRTRLKKKKKKTNKKY